jgi:hypothetical protein
MSATFCSGDFRFRLLDSLGPERVFWESRVLAAGLYLPMADSAGWSRTLGLRSWFLGVEDREGFCRGGAAIRVHSSRSLPGFRILRVERFGGNVPEAAHDATLHAFAKLARGLSRILRLHVELFSPAPGTLSGMAAAANRAGLHPSTEPRCYGETSLVDLGGDTEALLGRFHATARRHIRAVAKHPVAVRTVDDLALAERMNDLLRETLRRTGGAFESHDWKAILRYSVDYPERSRVIGLFRTDRCGPESLIAYAWGCFHGDHAHYSTAASTRASDLRLPRAYSLAWELMQWARAQGATYFDFGGLTAGSHGDSDPLGGISDFKRYFNGTPARVGEEWVVEPHPALARLGKALHRLRPS